MNDVTVTIHGQPQTPLREFAEALAALGAARVWVDCAGPGGRLLKELRWRGIEALPLPKPYGVVGTNDGKRMRFVPPRGIDAALWNPERWRGEFCQVPDPLGGPPRWYLFVEHPPEPDGTLVFGWELTSSPEYYGKETP